MDSRDSSSAASAAMARDGAHVADDEAILSLTSLAKEAALLFQSRKYAECVNVLMQLSHKKENDPKVLHNIAIAEFFRDGCLDHKKSVESLINVKTKCEHLARASGEQLDSALELTDKNGSGPKGINSSSHEISENSSTMLYTDESDSSVATLNTAIVLYHLHDYTRALSVLEPLFQNIEPIDEGTALHVCQLLLDLAAASRDTVKFADVISYVEKAYSIGHMNQAENGSLGPHPSIAAKTSSVPVTSTPIDLNLDVSASANATENSLSRTFSDEAAEYETLLSTLDMGSQGLPRLSNILSTNDLPRTPTDRISSTDLKLKLPLYKVQLLFLTGSLKMAKRELKLAMNVARSRDSSSALLLKSQLELARGNYVKAEKLLKASYNRADYGSSIMYNNNVGCIFYHWGKHNTAGVFFQRALVSCSSLRKEKPCDLARISQDKSLLIMYNTGLQYLASGKPIHAARCFQKASLVFYKKPLLWLRLAECSLLAFEKGLLKSFDHLLCGPEFRVSVVGQGIWRRLAIEDGLTRKGHVSSMVTEDTTGSDGTQHNLSLSFARQCLWNALELVRRLEPKSVNSGSPLKSTAEEKDSSLSSGQANANGDVKEQKVGNNARVATFSSSGYQDECRREILKIKQAILVDLAFVDLELGNPQATLLTARRIIEMPECSRLCSFLAHVYAAEALCLLNKPQEAAEQLSIYLSSGTSVDLPYTRADCEQWQANYPSDPEEQSAKNSSQEGHSTMFYNPEDARGALYVNLASMSAMAGKFEQAGQYAKQALLIIPNCKEANLMAVYLDLKLGRAEEAVSRLRRCSCVSYAPFGSRSERSS